MLVKLRTYHSDQIWGQSESFMNSSLSQHATRLISSAIYFGNQKSWLVIAKLNHFHFSFLYFEAFDNVQNREMKSESGVSLEMTSQPALKTFLCKFLGQHCSNFGSFSWFCQYWSYFKNPEDSTVMAKKCNFHIPVLAVASQKTL